MQRITEPVWPVASIYGLLFIYALELNRKPNYVFYSALINKLLSYAGTDPGQSRLQIYVYLLFCAVRNLF